MTLADGLQDGADLGIFVSFIDSAGDSFSGLLDIPVSGNNLLATDVDVLGSASDVLVPGESSYLKIELHNSGSTNALSISGSITCASPFIEILDHNGTWTSVDPGDFSFNDNDYFEVSTLEETIPGTIAHLIVSVETEEGYSSNSIIDVQIGEPTVYDPVGPDAYGYYIYDNEDINYVLAPTYNWVEIDAGEGGPGRARAAQGEARQGLLVEPGEARRSQGSQEEPSGARGNPRGREQPQWEP